MNVQVAITSDEYIPLFLHSRAQQRLAAAAQWLAETVYAVDALDYPLFSRIEGGYMIRVSLSDDPVVAVVEAEIVEAGGAEENLADLERLGEEFAVACAAERSARGRRLDIEGRLLSRLACGAPR